jgi:hypothetical protein
VEAMSDDDETAMLIIAALCLFAVLFFKFLIHATPY